jgi:hypothetical protein
MITISDNLRKYSYAMEGIEEFESLVSTPGKNLRVLAMRNLEYLRVHSWLLDLELKTQAHYEPLIEHACYLINESAKAIDRDMNALELIMQEKSK